MVLARLAGAIGERPPKTEQSATDCRWSWPTASRAQRRVWEVTTGGGDEVARGDVNQLLGQIEVETKRAASTRVYGCLLTPATKAKNDAAEAAGDKIALISHGAAVRLYDTLADRLRHYAGLCGDGIAEARGGARTKVEALLPADRWLEQLLSPTRGRVVGIDEVCETVSATVGVGLKRATPSARTTAASVLLLAGIAAVVSCTDTHTLALQHCRRPLS